MRMPGGARFNAQGLPPGSYVAAAFGWLDQGDEWDPRIQERAREVGERLSIAEGQKATVSLRLAGAQ